MMRRIYYGNSALFCEMKNVFISDIHCNGAIVIYLFIYLLACKLSNGLIKLAFHNSNNTKSTVPELSNFQNIFFSFYYD